MKKIYTIFTLLVSALCYMTAAAETRTVTIHVDDPTHIEKVVNYHKSSDIYQFGEDNTCQVTFDSDENVRILEVYAASGYTITSITATSGNTVVNKTFPNTYVTINGYSSSNGFSVENNDVIEIETEELAQKIITFKGNPDHISSVYPGTTKEDGVWEVDATSYDRSVTVSMKSGYPVS